MVIVIYILIVTVTALLSYAMFLRQERKFLLTAPIREVSLTKPKPVLSILSPLSKLIIDKFDRGASFSAKLLNIKSKFSAEEFLSLKIILAITLPLLTFFFVKKEWLWVILSVPIGFFLLDIWLIHKVKVRRAAIQRILPEVIDLLSLCIGAGLDFPGAVKWITEKAKSNVMIEELKVVLSEIQVGKSRLAALKDMAKRLNIIDVTSFVSNMVLAERMGTPVEEVFGILSDDIRMRRAQHGERLALKAPIKILIPLIFCILPIIMIVVAGPVLINFLQGDIGKGLILK